MTPKQKVFSFLRRPLLRGQSVVRGALTRYRSHPAQGMVEFALALPVLLLLIFGIIEFGRMLQAWLALENGARFAVRAAVTGSFDFKYCQQANDALGLYDWDNLDGVIDCKVPDRYPVGNPKAGEPVPNQEEYTNRLIDWARMPTIRDAALSGAYGVDWNPAVSISGDYIAYLQHAFDDLPTCGGKACPDYRGDPSQPRYLNVSMCSNRVYTIEGEDRWNDDGGHFMWDPNPFYHSYPPGANPDAYRFPVYCGVFAADNSPLRYVDDAGGPGDRVRVILTYRHTLITPFLSNWWPTLRLTSQREGIVEKFRTSRVTGLSGAIGLASTWTLTPTETYTPAPTATPTLTATPYNCAGTGILWQVWDNLSCNNSLDCLTNPTNNGAYPANPSAGQILPRFYSPANRANNFGTRMWGYVCAPYTGEYRFYISSDDSSELYLSNSQSPAGAARIANVPGYTNYREQWDKYANQESPVQVLNAGQLYYIEARHIESSGNDYVEVGWTGPGISSASPQVIAQTYLLPASPLPTLSPSPTPPPSCDILINRGDPERLAIMNQGDQLQSFLRNISSSFNVSLTGADLTYRGAWHDQVQGPPNALIFDKYLNIYDVTDVTLPLGSTTSFSHTFPSPKVVNPQTDFDFIWDFVYNFHMFPYMTTFPVPNPVPAPPYSPGPIDFQNFWWPSDYNGVIHYRVANLDCVMQVTGGVGPAITVVSSNGTLLDNRANRIVINLSPFWIRADVNWNGLSRDYVYMYVYDSTGKLVHWRRGATDNTCIFGSTSKSNPTSCRTRTPYVNNWDFGGTDNGILIVNGDYTLAVMARGETQNLPLSDLNGRVKTNLLLYNFSIMAPTPTPSRVPTQTNTPQPTSTATRTLVPSQTPLASITFTKTITRTITVTRTITLTRTITPIPSRTYTNQPTQTPTQCLTPIELGGCQ